MSERIKIPKEVSSNVRAVYKTDNGRHLAEVWINEGKFGVVIAISPHTFKKLVKGEAVCGEVHELVDEAETERVLQSQSHST